MGINRKNNIHNYIVKNIYKELSIEDWDKIENHEIKGVSPNIGVLSLISILC